MHVPVVLERQTQPNKQQYNRVHDLNDYIEHNPKIFEIVEINDVIVAKRELTRAHNNQLNSGDQMRAIVEAAC